MPSYCAFNCREQYVGCHRFDQKIFRTGLDRPYDGFDIFVARNKYNWERRTGFVKPGLQLRAAKSGYADIHKEAAKLVIAASLIKELFGTRTYLHLISGSR